MLDKTTFEYITPTTPQVSQMKMARDAASRYADLLQAIIPDGPDKTYLLRKLREVAMWANIAITRDASGLPRE